MKISAQTSLVDEIIVDNFAGGGGASTGIELATSRPVTIAINHDIEAIRMHKANHPYTEHYQASVWDIDPKVVCRGRPVALAWFSPDCKHFSRAKGGKPVNKNIRGLAWIVLRWAAKVRPKVIILENVPEFVTWGPVRHGKPVKSKSGQTFLKWLSQLKDLGYYIEYRKLRACDFGAPTIRERFFLVARCDGKPIVFPNPTHGNGKGLIPYHTAAECIDWSIPCKSIFGRKHPLKENTMRRIVKGLDKFTIRSAAPYIMVNNSTNRCKGLEEPLPTVTTSNRNFLTTPHISKFYGNVIGTDIRNPLPTVTAVDHNALTAAQLIQYHSETSNSEARGQALNEPIMTVDASPRYALTAAHIVKYYSGDNYSSANAPLHTITTKERNALVESHLCIMWHNNDCKKLDSRPSRITASGVYFGKIRTEIIKFAPNVSDYGNWFEIRDLLNKYCGYSIAEDEILILEINGEQYFISDIGMRMLEPRELYNAQGFPSDYIIDRDFEGKMYSRKEQVARCGNAVPPPFAEVLVRANLPELCGQKADTMQELEARMAL